MFFTGSIKNLNNTFSIRKRFGVLETIVFIIIEILVFVILLKLITGPLKQSEILAMLPSFMAITVAAFFIIGKYRQMEATPNSLKISRWGGKNPELEIKKTDLSGIEINFGFSFRPYFIQSPAFFRPYGPRQVYYVRIKFIYKDGHSIDIYKLKNKHVFTFKSQLEKFGYPSITETIRGKPMADKDRRIF